MSTYPRQPAVKGDRFEAPAGDVEVLRVSHHPDRPWVDIRVTQWHGATWTKRMPTGIPAEWVRVEAAA